MPEQGLLSQGQPAAPAPAPAAPAPAAPAPAAPAPAAPAPAPGQPAPAPPAAPAPGQSAPRQPERDYQSNPLNAEDKDNVDKFTIMATKLVHSPETREKVLGRIKGIKHPYDEIAEAALVVVNRIEKQGESDGAPWDKAVKLLGGANVVEMVVELAGAAGKVSQDLPEKDMSVIVAQTMQKYYNQKIATGEISKEEAARDAHLAAQAQAQMQGQDTTAITKRGVATQQLQKDSMNAPEAAAAAAVAASEGKGMDPENGGMQAPQPAADPMNPQTTMKETLAGGAGGLLNG